MNLRIVFWLLISYLVGFNCYSQGKPVVANPLVRNEKSEKININPDSDLKEYPDYYRKRILGFRNIIRKQKTKEAKIQIAIKMMGDQESKYRRQAIQFLAEVKAKEATQALVKVGEEKDFRPDAAFAIGEVMDERGIEFLIRCLYDLNDNVRGNAAMALRKIAKRDFGYNYSDNEEERNKSARLFENWWLTNRKTFKVVEITDEERKDADEKWEKYGKPYIEKLLKE